MKTTRPFPQQTSSINKKAESGKDPTDPAMIDFASVLDDFQGEEVVDKRGTPVGTLACYWQSVSGLVIFLGIKLQGEESVRVVPGRRSQVDERHSCIQVGFDAVDIASSPHFDCAMELDATLERIVYEHFGVGEAQAHGGLKYFARHRKRNLKSAASIGVEETDETRRDKPRQET
jgi:hypothetical protein